MSKWILIDSNHLHTSGLRKGRDAIKKQKYSAPQLFRKIEILAPWSPRANPANNLPWQLGGRGIPMCVPFLDRMCCTNALLFCGLFCGDAKAQRHNQDDGESVHQNESGKLGTKTDK
jgi:hypothetical protein